MTAGADALRPSSSPDLHWAIMDTAASRPRTYEVRTYGCQMNVHDS